MKKTFLLFICCYISIAGFAQIPVGYWSIENAAHTASTYTVTDQVSTGAGSAITAIGIGALATNTGAGTTLHAGAANGLALYANGNMSNAVADPTTGATTYWQFNLTTTGLSTITMTFDEIASAANPKYGVLYSTNGTTWNFVASSTTLNGNTLPLTAATWGTALISLPATCDNQATLYIRIYGYARTGGNTFKVDNITILAASTIAGAVFTTADEGDIYTMVRSGGAAGQFSRNNFTAVGAATNVTINNTTATSGVSIAAANTFSVATGATVTFGNTGLVNGAGTFNLNSGCTLVTANVGGISAAAATGSIRSTTRTFSGGANYTYNAAAAQVTGTGLPATLTSPAIVTINNGTGVTLTQTTTFQSGTSLNLQTGTFTNTAANLVMNSSTNVNRDNGTMAVTPTTYSGINLTYTNLGNNSNVTTGNEFPATFNGNVTINKTTRTITLQNAKTLPVLATFGNITLTAGTLASGNFNISLSGNWSNNSAAAAFTPGTATVTMNGTSAQTLGGSFSTSFNNFTLNNATGVTLGNTENVNGTLTLTAGRMTIGANNLVLGTATPAVAGALSSANMIIATGSGQVRKLRNANGSYVYPVGDAGPNYTPITLNFTAGTYGAGAYAGVNVTAAKHPNNANVADYINRYWSVATSGITAPTYAVTAATYVPADVVGTEANISAGQYAAVLPWIKYGVTNTVTHTLTIAATSSLTADFSGISTAGPSVSASAGVAICSGNSTPLSVVISTGDPTLNYSWAPATDLSSATGTPVTASPTVTTTYTLTVTDGNGFTNTATTTVTVTAAPSAILGASYVCLNSTTTLSDLTGSGVWTSTNPGIASIDPSTGLVNGLFAGVTTISYTSLSTGCAATGSFTVNPLPVIAAIGGVTNECLGQTATLTEITGSGIWTSADPAIASVTGGTVTGNNVGSTTISYTVTDGFGCVDFVTTPDTVNALPVIDLITGPANVCINASVTLSDDTVGGAWSSGNAAIATIDPVTGLVTGISVATVDITYTFTDINGCISFVTAPETVNPLPAILPVSGPVNECAGSTMQLSDAIAGGTWSSSSTGVATVGSSSGIVTGVAAGGDNISYTISNSFGCLNTAIYPITIGNAMPASAILPSDTSLTLCHGLPENLVINTTGTSLTYQWYKDGTPIPGATAGSYVVTVPGQYIAQLNNGTCVLNMPYTHVIAPPNPIIGYNSTGPSLFTGSFATYQWFLDGVAITTMSSGSSSAVLPVSLHGSYTVVVSDANGCFDTSAAFVYPTDTLTTGITTVPNTSEINLFPNPASSTVHISAPVNVNVSVMNLDGKMMMELKNATDINVASLPNGIYFIKITDEKNMLLKNQKFTKIE